LQVRFVVIIDETSQNANPTGFGELDRVSDQVDKNLPKPLCIGVDRLRDHTLIFDKEW